MRKEGRLESNCIKREKDKKKKGKPLNQKNKFL